MIMSPHHPFPLVVNPPQIPYTPDPIWAVFWSRVTRVTSISKLNTLMNKIERLHSTEASNGPLAMGWKSSAPGDFSDFQLFPSPDPGVPVDDWTK